MKPQWPTLEGRLNQPLTSRGEALRQLKDCGMELTPWAEKELQKYEETQRAKQRRTEKAKRQH